MENFHLIKRIILQKNITLDEYLEQAKATTKDEKETKTIYYITAKSKKEALANPYIDQFKNKNIDVLLLTDPIDEWIVQALTEYKQNKLESITDATLQETDLKEEDKQKLEEQKKEFIIKDNVWFWEWDFDLLANEWDVEELEDWWVDVPLSDEIDWVEELEEEEIKPYWKWYILIEEDIEKIPEIEKKIKNLWLNYNSSLWN